MKKYERLREAGSPVVEWDDIPTSIQRKIFRLEKEIDESGLDLNDPRIKKLSAMIDKLEKPYTHYV